MLGDIAESELVNLHFERLRNLILVSICFMSMSNLLEIDNISPINVPQSYHIHQIGCNCQKNSLREEESFTKYGMHQRCKMIFSTTSFIRYE